MAIERLFWKVFRASPGVFPISGILLPFVPTGYTIATAIARWGLRLLAMARERFPDHFAFLRRAATLSAIASGSGTAPN